jgi:hypothetical protein
MPDSSDPQIAVLRNQPFFRRLVVLAKNRQHSSLASNQYHMMVRAYLAMQPRGDGGLMNWYYANQWRLRQALVQEEITIRSPVQRPLHRFRLKKSGLTRLTELEEKIKAGRSNL